MSEVGNPGGNFDVETDVEFGKGRKKGIKNEDSVSGMIFRIDGGRSY